MSSREVTAPGARDGDLRGIRLEASRIEVRRTRAAVKSRLFQRPLEATRIGRFVVLSRVGMGGMGVVYEAYDPRLDRRVALKVMRDDVVRSRRRKQQAQLLREARAMARLSHPNVVAIYDAGTVDGQVFVAMEFVPSQTLRQWLADGRTVEEIVRVFVEAGRGLACAHAAGLVHCDFKPENVLIPAQGAVRVTDFGLARAAGQHEPGTSGMRPITAAPLTVHSFGHAGTPAYMAPEQIRGDPVDARVDQWAFCVTMYEALAGRRPFDESDIHAFARGERRAAPPLPPQVQVSPALRSALARGLSFDREDRFPDLDALLGALCPPRRMRRRVPVLAAAVLLGGTVAFAAWPSADPCRPPNDRMEGIWDHDTRAAVARKVQNAHAELGPETWTRLAPIVDAYADRWLDLRQRTCRASVDHALSPELLDLQARCLDTRLAELAAFAETLRASDTTVVAHAVESATRLTPLDACLDPKVLRELTPPHAPQAQRAESDALRARIRRAQALRRAGKVHEARDLLASAVSEAEQLGEPVALVEARLQRGLARAELADRDGAVEDFDAVLDRGAEIKYLTAVADAAIALVDVVGRDLARHEAGLDLARTAAIAVALAGDDPLRRARLRLARGRVLYLAGRTTEAVAESQAGLDALANLAPLPRARLERAFALRLLAKLALAAGEPSRAATLASEAITLFEGILGPAHPEVGETLAHRAAASLRTGDAARAKTDFERAAVIQRAAYGENHPAYGRTLANLGSTERMLGNPERALSLYRASLAILEGALGRDDPRVATLWVNIGGLETEVGRLAQAQAAYTTAIAALERSVGRSHPSTALALANVSRLALRRGDPNAAYAPAREALAIRLGLLGPDHVETARSRLALGDVLRARGDRKGAQAAYEAALETLLRTDAPVAEVAAARFDLAQILSERGNRRGARQQVERARADADDGLRAEITAWCENTRACGAPRASTAP